MVRPYKVLLVTTLLLVIPVLASAIPQKGKSLPPFEATAVTGQKVSSAAFAGKVVLLAISTDKCTYCKMAIPRLNTLFESYGKQGLLVQGLIRGPGFGLERLKRYIEENQVTHPLALATAETLGNIIGAYSVPSYVLLDRKGNVTGYYRGYSEKNIQEIEKQVKRLLAE
jgi:peroxiredoxin